MSVKLTTNLSQRLVLTPQLRQRIEMLQMTTLELSELIQQQMLENPVIEEVPSQEETHEWPEKLLDQLPSGDPGSSFDAPGPGSSAETNGAGPPLEDLSGHDANAEFAPESTGGEVAAAEGSEESEGEDRNRDPFEEIDF